MRVINYSKKSVGYGVPRRQFLNYMAMVSVIPFTSGYTEGKVNTSPKFSAYPFSLGIASGDPEPDGVVAQLAGQANGWLSRAGRLHLDFSSCRSAEPRPAHRDAKGALARVHRNS